MNTPDGRRRIACGLLILLAGGCTPTAIPTLIPTPAVLPPAVTATPFPGAVLPTSGPVIAVPADASSTPSAPPMATSIVVTADLAPPPLGLPTPVPLLPESGTQLLQQRQVFMGRLDLPGEIDRYAIFGEAGSLITVGMSPSPGSAIVPYFELYSPAGDVLARGETVPGLPDAVVIGLTLPSTGAYILFARDAGGQTTGEYAIAYGEGLTFLERAQGHTLPDTVYTGTLDRRGVRDAWTLDLTLGDVISAAAVSGDGAFNPILELIAPNGQVIRVDDNGGGGLNAVIRQVIAPQTGRFTLAISAAASSPPGTYTLIWRYDASAPTPTSGP